MKRAEISEESLWSILASWIRNLLPITSILVLMLVISSPLPLSIGISPMLPMLPLIALYYWTIYRPDILPIWTIFILGFLSDTLYATPIGINILIFMIIYSVSNSQRLFFIGKSFLVSWWGFSLLTAATTLLNWLLIIILERHILPFTPFAFQYILTLGMFPLMIWALAQLQMFVFKKED